MNYLVQAMRLKFLTLALGCVFLGFATSIYGDYPVSILELLLCLIGALSAHVAVNTINEYQDFTSGLDLKTSKTPFSGGSGAIVAEPSVLNSVKMVAIVSLLLTITIGLYLLTINSLWLVAYGVTGIAIIVTYTRYINTKPLLCLLAPGVGFGALIVLGTHFVLANTLELTAILASIIALIVVSNLLLLNQFPDAEADKTVGRDHFVIRYGYQSAALIYGVLSIAAIVIVIISCVFEFFPMIALFTLMPLVVALYVFVALKKLVFSDGVKELNSQQFVEQGNLITLLGLNVIVANVTPMLLALTLLISVY